MLLPATDPVTVHVPGLKNLIHCPSTLQTVGVVEEITGGIVNPKVTDFEDAKKYANQVFPPVFAHSAIEYLGLNPMKLTDCANFVGSSPIAALIAVGSTFGYLAGST
jgi:hypothetical protein